MKTPYLIAGLLVASTIALAQQKPVETEVDPVERSRQMIDNAMMQARTMQQNETRNTPRTGLNPDELRKMKGLDPATLAQKYQTAGVGQQKPEQELLVFISTSMPKKALLMLGEQAKLAGATLVMRGIKGDLGKKGAFEETMKLLQPVTATGATVQIDPESFARHEITAVPTFVIAAKDEGCGNQQCDIKSYALAGDVTLSYALEQWSSRGGNVGKLADMYLQRIMR